MSLPVEQIESEALSLPRQVRARLAERLIASLDDDPEIERAWEEEAERRYQAYLAGEMEAFPATDVIAEARARLRK